MFLSEGGIERGSSSVGILVCGVLIKRFLPANADYDNWTIQEAYLPVVGTPNLWKPKRRLSKQLQ
jgi:hypothetical protein